MEPNILSVWQRTSGLHVILTIKQTTQLKQQNKNIEHSYSYKRKATTRNWNEVYVNSLCDTLLVHKW